VVILGAGFDTRAYRIAELALKRVFEVDLPQVIQAKKVVLECLYGGIPAHVKLVAMDFDRQDTAQALAEAGYPMDQPAFFIWEGVTQYITGAAVRRTFDFLRGAAPGSQLVMTYIRQEFIDGEQLYGLDLLYRQTRVQKQFWVFGLEPGSVGEFLNGYGWVELEQAGTAEYRARYLDPLNRDLPVMEVERAVHASKDFTGAGRNPGVDDIA
jgi:methyltransferase (TIGR00027 family)